MARATRQRASVGVTENGNCAVLVTVSVDRQLLDRRKIELTQGLPTHPHHHEGSWAVGRYLSTPGARPMPLADAIALVDRVRTAAERGARESLEALVTDVAIPIATIALRACPELPTTTEERIRDNRAQTFADSVMYRQALALAAEERGWAVVWYEPENVYARASATFADKNLDALLAAMGRSAGAPWQAKHKLAAAAALATMGTRR